MSRDAKLQTQDALFRDGRPESSLDSALQCAASYLLSLQSNEGYWLGELEADTTLESDYIFYLHVLGRFEPQRVAKLANYIRRRQLPDGVGTSIQPGLRK